jgi:hypothetical protein
MTLGNQGNNMTDQYPHAEQQLRALIEVMARLRDPKDGCAWDLEQTHASIAPYTIEEAYEVAEAVDSQTRSAMNWGICCCKSSSKRALAKKPGILHLLTLLKRSPTK